MIGVRAHACALVLALTGCGGPTSSAASPGAPPVETAKEPGATEPPASGEQDAAEAPAAAEAPRANESHEKSASPTERLMKQHFESANAIRLAVIAGNRDDIFKPARKLVYLSNVEELPPEWQGPIARMQDAAERLKSSHDMETAAAATADIGTSCGYCHQRLGGPSAVLPQPPSRDGNIKTRMQQHAWATERLWEGLYVPSSEAWNAGIAILTDEPFPEEILHRGGVHARAAAQDFVKVVDQAPGKTKVEQKATIYAKLLATCATCHLATE